MGVKMLIDFIRGRDKAKDDKDSEANVHRRIDDLVAKQAEHETDDAAKFATITATLGAVKEKLDDVGSDVKTVLRRSTGKTP